MRSTGRDGRGEEVITSLRFGHTGVNTIQFNIGDPRNSESEEIIAVLKSLGATNLIERTHSFLLSRGITIPIHTPKQLIAVIVGQPSQMEERRKSKFIVQLRHRPKGGGHAHHSLLSP